MVAGRWDPALTPFLEARTEAESQRQLERLVETHIKPKARMALRSKLGAVGQGGKVEGREQADWEDLHGEIVAHLLLRLHEAKTRQDSSPIQSLPDYVAVTAYNAVNMHLRRRYPKRRSLNNKLRYLLERRPGLALWRSAQGEDVCGYAVWQEQKRGAENSVKQNRLLDDPDRFLREILPRDHPQTMDPTRLLTALFNGVGHPIRLDDLTRILAELWDVKDLPTEPPPDDDLLTSDTPGLSESSPESAVLSGMDMRRYWSAISALPPFQCAALLLQAHDADGNSLIELLEMEGVVSFREMAQAMNLTGQELAALANDLPMNDAKIAERLGVTTQHVARLRMLARRRLLETMREETRH